MVGEGGPRADTPCDQGYRCLACGYNLTGLTGARCPECGRTIDWERVREISLDRRSHVRVPWECWPVTLKPLGFVLTMVHVALTPWLFARRIPPNPKLGQSAIFAGICFASVAVIVAMFRDDWQSSVAWGPTALACLAVQVLFYGFVAPPQHSRHRFRFWLVVCCYCSYPLIPEALLDGPPVLAIDASGNIYGGHPWLDFSWSTSLLFHLWWVNLLVIAAIRTRPPKWWRLMAVAISVPLITVGTTYMGSFILEMAR